jgi:hypothetical protein
MAGNHGVRIWLRFLLGLIVAGGCATHAVVPPSAEKREPTDVLPQSADERELTAVLRAALKFLERPADDDPKGPTLTLVAGDELSPAELRVLGHVRPFIVMSQVPRSPEEELPANYLIVEGIEVHGDKGRFDGLLGPVPRNPPGKEDRILLACGEHYWLQLVKTPDGWTVRVITTGAC